MTRFLAVAALGLTLAMAPAAQAADPAEGKISRSAPKLKWSGASDFGFITTFSQIFTNAAGAPTVCEPSPSCDVFSLEVVDGGGTVQFDATTTATITYVEVVKPDGSVLYADGIDPEGKDDPTTKLKIAKAPAGTYTVRVAVNSLTPETYAGSATLSFPDEAPAAAPVAVAPTAVTAPAAAPATPDCAFRTTKASARKAKRKLAVKVRCTGEVTGVTLQLKRGSTVLSRIALPRLAGDATVAFKLKRALKAGRYSLVLAGKTAGGNLGVSGMLKLSR
jgi:hypothetical protein